MIIKKHRTTVINTDTKISIYPVIQDPIRRRTDNTQQTPKHFLIIRDRFWARPRKNPNHPRARFHFFGPDAEKELSYERFDQLV